MKWSIIKYLRLNFQSYFQAQVRRAMRLFLLSGVLLIQLLGTSQNLVPNPGFEDYINCPSSHSQMPSHWTHVSGHGGSPDYYNTCSDNYNPLKRLYTGYLPYITGDGVMGFYSWDDGLSELVQVELLDSLTYGQYSVRFKLILGERCGIANNGFGALFSNTSELDIELPGTLGLSENYVHSDSIITQKGEWVEVNLTYNARGGEKFVTLGNILAPLSESERIESSYEFLSVSYYYIDDVVVEKILCQYSYDTLDDKNLCFGDSLQILIPEKHEIVTSNFHNFVFEPGQYNWTLYDSINNCLIRDTFLIEVDTVSIALGEDTSICQGDSIFIGEAIKDQRFIWGDGQVTSPIAVLIGGEYTIEVRKGECSDFDSINIDVILPIPSLVSIDTVVCVGEEYIHVLINGNYKYTWDDRSVSQEKSFYQTENTTALVYNSCFTDSVYVDVEFKECQCEVFIPNAFSPNYDNLNDYFEALSVCNFEIENFEIYNRWGEKLAVEYSNQGWDGRNDKSPCPQGVYLYIFKLTTSNGKSSIRSGTVHLLR
jgi:gliding motility-associated-like protein